MFLTALWKKEKSTIIESRTKICVLRGCRRNRYWQGKGNEKSLLCTSQIMLLNFQTKCQRRTAVLGSSDFDLLWCTANTPQFMTWKKTRHERHELLFVQHEIFLLPFCLWNARIWTSTLRSHRPLLHCTMGCSSRIIAASAMQLRFYVLSRIEVEILKVFSQNMSNF